MSSLEAVDTRLTFDDILEAVQDSKRGRWFLQEFEARIKKQDSQSILQAISRLETRMDGFDKQPANADELSRVKAAIATARHDLLKMGVGKDALSPEGRLFANLAEMARKAMPLAVDSNAGIVRTLQLVEEIDRTISPPKDVDRGASYFAADANLFERATPAVAKPTLVPPAAAAPPPKPEKPVEAKKEEPVSTGAKLVIRKTVSNETAVPQAAAEVIVPAAEAMPEQLEVPTLSAIDSPRIVIVRRKVEDMPEISMTEEPDKVSAA